MGRIRAPRPVKLFVGMLSSDRDLMRRCAQLLSRCFGPLDLSSDVWPFTFTDYYAAEMGPGLLRQFISFASLIPADTLAEIKRQTNQLEQQVAEECLADTDHRPVNLDPGYMDPGKLVLATTKDRSHRIYLGAGIFAEVTLHYMNNAWRAWPWTYPDYQSRDYLAYFDALRARLIQQHDERPGTATTPEQPA
ncbi:MAG: hypothetical protein CHACPFDD_01535 [Phycisphaerae bacterium]|nr:hypothetical protein [Phycisphaerae bacterium]